MVLGVVLAKTSRKAVKKTNKPRGNWIIWERLVKPKNPSRIVGHGITLNMLPLALCAMVKRKKKIVADDGTVFVLAEWNKKPVIECYREETGYPSHIYDLKTRKLIMVGRTYKRYIDLNSARLKPFSERREKR